jgi:hypothetical protein
MSGTPSGTLSGTPSGTPAAALGVLLDLATGVALLWMTVSDGWLPIAVSAALVALRAVPGGIDRLAHPGSG